MPVNDDLGKRMKEFYEQVPKTRLVRRTPVAIRIDGKAFHTFTKGFQKPFDRILMHTMQQTMEYLCKNIQGCVFGYTQSDEITLILVDYQSLTTAAWFDYEVQKLCSVSASMATMVFNNFFSQNLQREILEHKVGFVPQSMDEQKEITKYHDTLRRAKERGALFDARCFNIPKEEVTNLVYWRQLDATRNSIQMVGHANFSDRELHGKSCNDIQDMLIAQRNINWNELPTHCKRGTACIYDEGKWIIDMDMPILKGEGRQYLDRYIYIAE